MRATCLSVIFTQSKKKAVPSRSLLCIGDCIAHCAQHQAVRRSADMALADELQALAVQAQAAAAIQGDTVRSLKASQKDGKADKVSGG